MSTPSSETFRAVYHDAVDRMLNHLQAEEIGDGAASAYAPLAQVLSELDAEHWLRHGGMNAESVQPFLDRYLDRSVKLRHPLHMAHQVSVPDYPAGLAAMINGLTNNPMAVYEMGPAAAALEFAVINWMLEAVGWSAQLMRLDNADAQHGAGVLTHGGSLANLTCLLAARGRAVPNAWQDGVPSDLVVMVPPTSHYSIARALSIIGLGEAAIEPMPEGEWGRVASDGLARSLAAITARGKRCIAVVANACATATGLHDPLRDIGEFCQANDLWFHVDACHGATALLSDTERHWLDGIELADSVVWDTHKMMQVPALCAAVLFRDHRSFAHLFEQDASYLAYGDDADSYDSLPRALECTKAALSFKVFMNVAWRGAEALGAYVANQYATARRFFQLINARSGFDCPFEPETNILLFRYGDDDALQQRIRDEMVREGSAHITSAMVAGRRWLRLTVMNPLSDDAALNRVLDLIESKAT